MTINGVYTVDSRTTIRMQLLIAAYMHGKRDAIGILLEELYGYYSDPV